VDCVVIALPSFPTRRSSDLGYGIVRPDVERRVLKAAATKGASLPKNFSDEAKDSFIKERERLSETYPYGVFWNGDAVAGYKINRDRKSTRLNSSHVKISYAV